MENPEKEEEESGVDCFFLQLNSPLVKKLRAGSVRLAGQPAAPPCRLLLLPRSRLPFLHQKLSQQRNGGGRERGKEGGRLNSNFHFEVLGLCDRLQGLEKGLLLAWKIKM